MPSSAPVSQRTDAIIGTGRKSTNAIIGTGKDHHAIIGTGSADAIIGTGADAIIGTGAQKSASTDAIIGTGAQKSASTDAIIGTGKTTVFLVGPIDSVNVATGTISVLGETSQDAFN